LRYQEDAMQQQQKGIGVPPTTHLQRVSWKNALRSVFGAAWRVHHYRDVHTRMMHDALCSLDFRPPAEHCNDDQQS
jgi:hypothetical protein